MKLEPATMSESFARKISRAGGSDLALICAEVTAGNAQAFRFIVDNIIVGYAVTRLENDTCVVVVYEGENVDAFADFIVRVCEAQKIPYARFHSTRPGLIKMLARLKPEPLEYVTRIRCYGR